MPSRHGSPRLEGDQAEDEEEQHLMEGSGTGSSVGGRSAAATSKSGGGAAWPKAWEPTGHESAVRLDPSASFSLLALPKFSQLSDDEYHALYGTVARIPLPVFDLLLSLYFSHFHPLLPLLHVPSFNPKKTLGQLLLIILGIGAVYAPIPGALQLGRVLVEVARRGIEHLINRDNRLARSLPIVRFLSRFFRKASPFANTRRGLAGLRAHSYLYRTVELAEVFRSVHTTMLRRQRVFDESGLRSAHDESPIAQWSAFIANEERRRTAMACYLLEGEVACLLHLPLSINSSELQTLLPCSEALWNAPNAEAWLQLKANTTEPVTIPFVTKLLTSDSSLSIPATISLSPFGAQ
ncbi:fungal-specific transcription factor domain-domain-containing protein [Leucosporidium creatinivorum]|uniref:Fungal-specific transcription factor domain-domain-containing protein n=1 Tax=Leucosporidium creatinivorum TaxID=106004 RepID=A0A1Y2FRN3_9BASI|nr:fungal-specific transcription factor domain-domain-containing protein [Leucosporidium creatinivorum]